MVSFTLNPWNQNVLKMLRNRSRTLRKGYHVAVALAALGLFAPLAHSQTHSASLSWTLSTSSAVISQNVYRAPCNGTVSGGVCSAEGAFAKITSPSATTTSYTDNSVAAGASYAYYVTAVCPATGACQGESMPSNHIAAVVPGNTPPPPTGLTITSVALLINGTTQTVTAKWTDPSGTQQSFAFTNGTSYVNQGLTSSLTGTFAEQYTSPVGVPVTFTVCNATGACATQKAM